MSLNLPPGWMKGTPAVDLASFIHPASGFEVGEDLRGWRVYGPNGRPLRGTYETVAKAIKAAQEAMETRP